MPTCPNCKTYFRTLEDEQYMHDCPKCGFSPEDIAEEINYDTLRKQYFDNCNMSKWKQDVVAKFIDHCEEEDVPLEQVIFYLYDESQVGCCHDCDMCPTPIC